MAASYRWDAADYAAHSAVQYEWARELIAKLHLAGTEALLDIGCGDGKVTALVAAQLPAGRAVGVDNSPGMIALAQERFPASRHGNIRFHLMDARALEFDSEFDVAFSNATLHWVADHPAVLRGVRRALMPGGRLLLQMGGRGNAAAVVAAFGRVTAGASWRDYFGGFSVPYYFYAPEHYAIWLPEAGFGPVRIELIPKDMRHAGAAGLAGWLRTTWMPYLERAPEELRERLVGEVAAAYLEEHPPDAAGLVHVDMVRLEVEAAVCS